MKRKFNKSNRLVASLVLGILFVGSAVVFANNSSAFNFGSRPQVSVALVGSLVRDNQTLTLDKVDTVKPGEVLHWTITSENKSDGNAQQYKAVGKVPAGTVFVADSAKAEGAEVTYSIDAGKNFSKQPMIEEKQADGTVKMVPAPVSMYSQVRFEWQAALNATEKSTASYDVKVK